MKIIDFLILLGLFSTLSCSKSSSDGNAQNISIEQQEISETIFSDSIDELNIEVYFETGATPYTGTLGLSGDPTWDITEESYQALFQGHIGRTISVPKTTGEMTEIPDQSQPEWTGEELVVLGESLSPTLGENNTVTLPIIFLNGLFEGNSSVLGVQISGHHYAFIFKDVVTSVGGGANTQRYVEQATVVHELGHVVGLVNNGLPMAANHEDSAHTKHTINEDGVMYWTVESSDNILSFLTDIIASDQRNLFEVESLQDAQDYHP